MAMGCWHSLAFGLSQIRKNQAGFSLVELVMVIVLLSILSVTALPKFFDLSVFQKQAFFNDVMVAVRYAQKLAVASGCKVQVSVSGNGYALNQPAARNQCLSGVPVFSQSVRHPGTGSAVYSNSENGITLTSIPASYYFDALGRASVAAVMTIGGDKTITVVSETGYVY